MNTHDKLRRIELPTYNIHDPQIEIHIPSIARKLNYALEHLKGEYFIIGVHAYGNVDEVQEEVLRTGIITKNAFFYPGVSSAPLAIAQSMIEKFFRMNVESMPWPCSLDMILFYDKKQVFIEDKVTQFPTGAYSALEEVTRIVGSHKGRLN